jgi:hypothetical protein
MSDAANRHTSDVHIWPRNEGALRKKVTLTLADESSLNSGLKVGLIRFFIGSPN